VEEVKEALDRAEVWEEVQQEAEEKEEWVAEEQVHQENVYAHNAGQGHHISEGSHVLIKNALIATPLW